MQLLERKHQAEMQLEKERMQLEREKLVAETDRTRIEVSGGKFQVGTEGATKIDSFETQMARSMKLVPAFDEHKVAEWFRRFEKKAREYGWPEER